MLRLRIKLPEACYLNNSVPDTWKLLRKVFGLLVHVKNSMLSFIAYCNQRLEIQLIQVHLPLLCSE